MEEMPGNHEHLTQMRYDGNEVWGVNPSPRERESIGVCQSLIPNEARSVLDVRYGKGRITKCIAERGCFVVRLDLTRKALASLTLPMCGATVFSLPFQNKAFDVVTEFEILEHLPTYLLALAVSEIRRISKRWIVVAVPFREPLWASMVKCAGCGSIIIRMGTSHHGRRLPYVPYLLRSLKQVSAVAYL